MTRYWKWHCVAAMVVLLFVAAAAQEPDVSWDPISCWDCSSGQDLSYYIEPVAWGYAIGGFIGALGVGRRRFAALDPSRGVLGLTES
jgi:hypothetical protein